jgi:hypothetical protein
MNREKTRVFMRSGIDLPPAQLIMSRIDLMGSIRFLDIEIFSLEGAKHGCKCEKGDDQDGAAESFGGKCRNYQEAGFRAYG